MSYSSTGGWLSDLLIPLPVHAVLDIGTQEATPCTPLRESDSWYKVRTMQVALNNVGRLMGYSAISVDGQIGDKTVLLYSKVFGLWPASAFDLWPKTPPCEDIAIKIDRIIPALSQKFALMKAASEPPPESKYAQPGFEPYQRDVNLALEDKERVRKMCPPDIPGCQRALSLGSPIVLGALAVGGTILFLKMRGKR